MQLITVIRPATLALFLAALAPLRADLYDLSPTPYTVPEGLGSVYYAENGPAGTILPAAPMPSGHSYIISVGVREGISMTTGLPFTKVTLWTLDEAYETVRRPVGAEEGKPFGIFTKIATLRTLVRPRDTSLVREDPANPNFWWVTSYDADDSVHLYKVQQSPPAVIGGSMLNGQPDLPRDFAVTADGSFFLLNGDNDIFRIDEYGDDPTLIHTAPTDPVISSLEVAGDVVFTLDLGTNPTDPGTVRRFSTNGDFLGSYTLANMARPGAFVVSGNGVLYAMESGGSDYGGIYDATTGAYLGRFLLPASDVNDPKSGGGKASMALSGSMLVATSGTGRYLWSYDISGVSAVPEPGATAALIGAGAVALVALRRRRK